ncbi:MAG: hypothetical protein AB1797_05565 [bacterium]
MQITDPRCSMLDARCLILDPRSLIFDSLPASSIEYRGRPMMSVPS